MVHLVLTPGDPTGIGPEITIKALTRLYMFPSLEVTVVGSVRALEVAAKKQYRSLPENRSIRYHAIEDKKPGQVSYKSIETAVKLIRAGKADALVTGPISKNNLRLAGYRAEGHTEILERLAHQYYKSPSAKAEMLFVYEKLRLMLLTRHIPIRDVPKALKKTSELKKACATLSQYLRAVEIHAPRIALLGLNPHAGEVGGDEEKKILSPLVRYMEKSCKVSCVGPLAADGFFRNLKVANLPYDAIIAPYHDQGLIPFKMLAGYDAVNVTIGLPFHRTSVSHGTAEDIAGQGQASESSLMAAIRTALLMKKLSASA